MDSKLLVLIAEDNEDDAFIIQRALTKAGLTNPTHVCLDGADVIAYLKGQGAYGDRKLYPFPRMLLLDLKMPRINGFDLLRWMKENPVCAVIPTMVFSSSNQPRDVQQAYALGANAYLMKPSTPQDIEKLVRALHAFWSYCELPSISDDCRESQ